MAACPSSSGGPAASSTTPPWNCPGYRTSSPGPIPRGGRSPPPARAPAVATPAPTADFPYGCAREADSSEADRRSHPAGTGFLDGVVGVEGRYRVDHVGGISAAGIGRHAAVIPGDGGGDRVRIPKTPQHARVQSASADSLPRSGISPSLVHSSVSGSTFERSDMSSPAIGFARSIIAWRVCSPIVWCACATFSGGNGPRQGAAPTCSSHSVRG